MNKITTIGITSPCGGNGCTTLAVHLAWQASQIRGIRTLAVSMDRTGALVRQFFPDGGLRVDSVAHILPNLDVCYFAVEGAVSELLPTLGLKADEYPSLIVVDLGSGMSSDLLEDVDLWLTPVADLRTMRALLNTGYPRNGKAKTYIAFNRAERDNQYARRLLAEAGDRCSDLSILHSEIPHSGAIQRANHRHETVWQHSRESRAATMLRKLSCEVLLLAMPSARSRWGKGQADEASPPVKAVTPPKQPGAGLMSDELLRMDQNLLDEQARKLEGRLRKLDEILCPVCDKNTLTGETCSNKCRRALRRQNEERRQKEGQADGAMPPAEAVTTPNMSDERRRLRTLLLEASRLQLKIRKVAEATPLSDQMTELSKAASGSFDEKVRKLEERLRKDEPTNRSKRPAATIYYEPTNLSERPAETCPTGKWMQGERKRLGLSVRKTVRLLGITEWSLRNMKDNDVVPKAWMAMLAVLGFRVADFDSRLPLAAEPLLPSVEPAAYPLAGLAAPDVNDEQIRQRIQQLFAIGSSEQVAPPIEQEVAPVVSYPEAACECVREPPIEQEVAPVSGGDPQRVLDDQGAPATNQLVPIAGIRQTTPESQPKAEQVEPRKAWPLPLSPGKRSFDRLQERIDAANAKLEAASLQTRRPTRRKPSSR